MLYQTKSEMLVALGESVRAARLAQNLTLAETAARADVSMSALRHLESGRNATTEVLLSVCRTLRRTDWILNIAPPEVSDALFDAPPAKKRLRASPRKGVSA